MTFSEVWKKLNTIKILRPYPDSEWFYEIKIDSEMEDLGGLWITGKNTFWLMSNGWVRI
jgi:hypothetical protein